MKTIILYLTLISLLLSLISNMQAATRTEVLGDMVFFEVVATSNPTITGSTVDGNITSNASGWGLAPEDQLAGSDSQNITWSWQPHSAPTLSQGESINHYTYTINLHNGIRTTNVDFLLKSYSLALGDPNSDNFTTITDYQSLSNTQEAAANGHTLSADANGLINTTKANVIGLADIHTSKGGGFTVERYI